MQAIKAMRALRLMRLVRLIARSPSMLNVVQSISLSVKEMSNVVFILLLIITIFAILGVQLFAGKLYYCTDPAATGKADCVGALMVQLARLTSALPPAAITPAALAWLQHGYACIEVAVPAMRSWVRVVLLGVAVAGGGSPVWLR